MSDKGGRPILFVITSPGVPIDSAPVGAQTHVVELENQGAAVVRYAVRPRVSPRQSLRHQTIARSCQERACWSSSLPERS